MKIGIVGSGYVGLVSGACLAKMGHSVFCFDIDVSKIERLNRKECPIYEPQLEGLITEHTGKNLHFSSSFEPLAQADVVMLAVDTPQGKEGKADTSRLALFVEENAAYLSKIPLLVTKSTVPPGTSGWLKRKIETILEERGERVTVRVASNPEFLKEGDAVNDFLFPDRVILGVEDSFSENLLKEVYAPLNLEKDKIFVMDPVSSEISKYAANAMLATRISFMNELSVFCGKVGGNIQQVMEAVGSDSRIGRAFLKAGIGYGGSCLPKDTQAISYLAESLGVDLSIIKAAIKANFSQREYVFNQVCAFLKAQGSIKGKKVLIWGLSFKPGTDDLREAPALWLLQALLKEGATVYAIDPCSAQKAKNILPDHPGLHFVEEVEGVYNAHVLVTEWPSFKEKIEKLPNVEAKTLFFDARNFLDRKVLEEKGYFYLRIGDAELFGQKPSDFFIKEGSFIQKNEPSYL